MIEISLELIIALIGAITGIIGAVTGVISLIWHIRKDKRKRQDLEQIRLKKGIANDAKTFDMDFIANHYEKEAQIIEDTKED